MQAKTGQKERKIKTPMWWRCSVFFISQIEQDYEELFQGRGQLLHAKWPVVSACILEYSSRVCPGWKARFNIQHREDTDLTQGMILFRAINCNQIVNNALLFVITHVYCHELIWLMSQIYMMSTLISYSFSYLSYDVNHYALNVLGYMHA